MFTLDFGSGLMLGPAQSELLLGRGSSPTAGRWPGEGVVVAADVQTARECVIKREREKILILNKYKVQGGCVFLTYPQL